MIFGLDGTSPSDRHHGFGDDEQFLPRLHPARKCRAATGRERLAAAGPAGLVVVGSVRRPKWILPVNFIYPRFPVARISMAIINLQIVVLT